MNGVTPRRVHLLCQYPDGENARHFSFRIARPQPRDFEVIPGQFFMLSVPGYGEAPFSYVSVPDLEGRFDALIRRQGGLTAALFEQPEGALLGYRGPFGKGWPLLLGNERLLLVAGGCGLAPLAGVVDEAGLALYPIRMTVIYGARHRQSQVLGRERERWKGRVTLHETCDDEPLGQCHGNPLQQLRTQLVLERPDAVFCCGPEPFMQAVAGECLKHGVLANRIWLSIERNMACGTGLCGHCYLGSSYVCTDGPTYRYDRYRELLGSGNAHPPTFSSEFC
ncbi:FAD-binding oxidoreductase [Pseudomonas boanensis]|uniref:iron-sulfur cluster-binding protein n=1 Tax=Metapseudomonas boanensis TaxID=2822138 RepID=UPI0035D5198F